MLRVFFFAIMFGYAMTGSVPLELHKHSVAKLCLGDELSEKVKQWTKGGNCRSMEPGEDEQCRFEVINWITEGQVNRKRVGKFMEHTALAEALRKKEKYCYKATKALVNTGGKVPENMPWIWKILKKIPKCEQTPWGTCALSKSARFYLYCVKFSFQYACAKKANDLLTMVANGMDKERDEDGWEETEVIPEKLETIPKQPALVSFTSGVAARPGMIVKTEEMLDPPYVYWDADPYSYYTLMVEDVDLNGGRRYFHFLLYNIPGNNVTAGQVAFDWAPSFAFNLDTSSSPPVLNTEDRDFTHAHLYLIYRQPGKIQMDEKQVGCTDDIASGDRIQTSHEDLSEKYKLNGPIAGNVIRVPYTEKGTDQMLCYYSKCTGQPWPVSLPGVNDGDDCQ